MCVQAFLEGRLFCFKVSFNCLATSEISVLCCMKTTDTFVRSWLGKSFISYQYLSSLVFV